VVRVRQSELAIRSVGGGFVVNEKTKVDENLFYKGVDKHKVDPARLTQQGDASGQPKEEHPPFIYHSGDSLLALTKKHNMTIAQIVYDNERYFFSHDDIHSKV